MRVCESHARSKNRIQCLAFLFLVLPLSACGTNNKSDELIELGPNKQTSLVVFFKKETTRKQIEEFYDSKISIPSPDGGYALPKSVALVYQIKHDGYEGVGITFSIDATQEERERLKREIESSPIVYKVFENVIPNQIKLE